MGTSFFSIGHFPIGHTIDITERTSSPLAAQPETVCAEPENVWFERLKLLFTMSVKIDGQEQPVDIERAYVSFCCEGKFEPSGIY